MSYDIRIGGLSHSFASHCVLKDIHLNMSSGEILGLLGPSGAGKTTLIKILTGQLIPDCGVAEILGKNSKCLGSLEHRQIGVMMDDDGLYQRLSVYNNLSFYADIYRVPHSEINKTLKAFGLYEARKTPVFHISKGMKSRLSLARALMSHPKILFLDEPTSGLDPTTTREVHKILREQQSHGTSIFLTTHNMFEAESLCDHVALLNEGSIIEYGAPKDISRKYDRLNRLEVGLKDGKTVTLQNDEGAILPLTEYLKKKQIVTIHSTEPTLESVFVELTGKGLYENA